MEFEWVDGFAIRVSVDGGAVLVSANREGMLSLANHLAALAQGESGDHFHLDEHDSLEEGSNELVIELADEP